MNIDHVATLREARGVAYPDPLEAAKLALEAGADGITVHLRQDRRHIQDDDVRRLRQSVDSKLNLEMAATDEMLDIALDIRPDQVTLVPERADEVTTEGGLDLEAHGARIFAVAARLRDRRIAVSLFLDPVDHQIRAIERGGLVTGFEINTDAYSKSPGDGSRLQAIRAAAALGTELGLHVYAGHGLTVGNVGPVAAVPQIEELNIGHSIVSRAVLVGMAVAVREIREAVERGQESGVRS